MWTFGIPTPVALATVAAIGYLFGRRHRVQETRHGDPQRDVQRAKAIIRQLESTSQQVRRSLATHHASVQRFKDRLTALSRQKDGDAWRQLSDEIQIVLKPTLSLSKDIARAYDAFREQTGKLMVFTEMRIDPLTGLSNRRALNETLSDLFAMMARYHTVFSLAIFDGDTSQESDDEDRRGCGNHRLQRVARILEKRVRDTDLAVRFGPQEFAVVMPETDAAGACAFAEAIRQAVEDELSMGISGGVAVALDGDSPQTLVARADCALYTAKSTGRAAVYRHNGQHVEPVTPDPSHETTPDLGTPAPQSDKAVVEEPCGRRRAADARACCG